MTLCIAYGPIHIRDKCIFASYAEIQDGRQKFQICAKRYVQKKVETDSLYTFGVQKILSKHSISHHFQHKCVILKNSRWPPKMAGKTILGKNWQIALHIPGGGEYFNEIALSHTVSEINVFLTFT